MANNTQSVSLQARKVVVVFLCLIVKFDLNWINCQFPSRLISKVTIRKSVKNQKFKSALDNNFYHYQYSKFALD